MNWIAWTVLTALIVDFGLHLAADILNLKQPTTRLPQAFAGRYDAQRYKLSQDYLKARTRLAMVAAVSHLTAVLLFWFLGGFQWVDESIRRIPLGPVPMGVTYIGVLAAARALATLPFDLWSIFVVEARFGFNRTTWATWLVDRLKGAALAVLIGAPILGVVLYLLMAAGAWAWVYCWVSLTVFMLLLEMVTPVWILPLFNRFEPLSAGPLREAIEQYARSVDFAVRNIFVMDGSKRSSKANAFFVGFGRNRRIVLFDTLVADHDIDAIVAVLAHEMGHFKHHHIGKMMAAGILQTGVVFCLLSFCISYRPLFDAFYLQQVSVHAGLAIFGLLYSPVALFSGVLLNAVSRRHEAIADRFAVRTTGRPKALHEALVKLTVTNLGNLFPHPLDVILNHSHPPILHRLAAITEPAEAKPSSLRT
jgi:STE24 endopeptidase